jgi:hypothetical protein
MVCLPGLMTALQNLGLAVAPLVIGPLVENDDLDSYVTAVNTNATRATRAVTTSCTASCEIPANHPSFS